MIRQCPKCGKIFKGNRSRCNGYFPGGKRCETVTVDISDKPIEVEPEDDMEPVHAILSPVEPEPEKELPFKGRAGQIIDILMESSPLTYNELAEKMGVTYKRAARLISQMVRDGVNLKREGKPRKVSLEQ